ncbi:hypothetical protein C8J57DRAFT_1678968 [Mycena rebaudengoi]|nr:hypothetical protein C8J57DRAFT_1678968 [Mycena rebaudengoi]
MARFGGVNAYNDIFRYTGDSNHWIKIPGALKRISVGSRTDVWGVNAGGNIYRYTSNDSKPWVRIPGSLTDIGAGADGRVWGVNSAGNIYRYTGHEGDPNAWVPISGNLSAMSAGIKTNVWGWTAQAASTRIRAMIVVPGLRSMVAWSILVQVWMVWFGASPRMAAFIAGFVISLITIPLYFIDFGSHGVGSRLASSRLRNA